MNGNWLILETSGRVGKVGLAHAGAIVRSISLDDNRRHARDLATTVETVLKEGSLAPTDLTGVMVGRGPGSYTGPRVGLMSAKALAYAVGCELRAVDTFASIAEQTPSEARSVWVIADALQNQLYTQQFKRCQGGWTAANELRILALDEWLTMARAGTWISGPGVDVHANRISQTCLIVPEAEREPRVESLFAVGKRLPPLRREEIFTIEPLYLRGSTAEERARGK